MNTANDLLCQNLSFHQLVMNFSCLMIGMNAQVSIAPLSARFSALYISSFIKSHYYFQDLPEPKYLRLLANAEHSTVLNGLSNPHFIFSLRSLFVATIKGKYESYNMTSLPFLYNVI